MASPALAPRRPFVENLPNPIMRWLGREHTKHWQGPEYAKSRIGIEWYPQTQSQWDALNNQADILLLSGSAGSLKTSTMLVEGVQYKESPKMNTYFYRRTYPAMSRQAEHQG